MNSAEDKEIQKRKVHYDIAKGFVPDPEPDELIPPGLVSIGMSKIEQVKDVLLEYLNFRYNIITGKVEFKKKDTTDYREFKDRDFNTIRSRLTEFYIKSLSEADLRMIIDSDFTPEYNPIDEYFKNLEPWDSVDYITQLAKLVILKKGQFDCNKSKSFDIWCNYLCRWLVATTATMLQRYHNHTCLTLLGPQQGLGKTWFLRNLGIDDHYVYVGSINPGDRDSKLMYAEKVLIVLDELEGTTKFEMASLKSNMTLTSIDVRRPYGRRREKLPRLASFAACANDVQILPDLTGSRRWLCVEVDDVDYMSVTPELMRKVYSQALYLLDQGWRGWFEKNEIIELEKKNTRFYAPCPEEEAIIKNFKPCKFNIATIFKTNTEILQHLSYKYPNIRFGSKKLGQVLLKLGFERGKKDGVYCYAVELSDQG